MHDLRGGYHEELDEVRELIVTLAAHVTEAIPRATTALIDGDLELAQQVIQHDDEIDLLSLQIEERCYALIALQQPMASDMRALVTGMKINGEYERSGDLAVNICKGLRRAYAMKLSPELRGLITSMSEESVRLTRLSVDAYAESNIGLASALPDIDDRLDDLQKDFIEAIFTAHNNGELELQETVQLALIARYYERIGDHAVNIGERVQYMVTGEAPETIGVRRADSEHVIPLAEMEAAEEQGGED
ncbi:MAG: phosphate signaling complex protein PhoU [Acidimicrobiales bacterium]|nr:phosphate signaling complex protein PhoU [Acidimicrobiales bacterium]RZV47659.1 MAG: phosphate signaling complex protein PhoU [Acidimicrobiales bacterium]